MPRKRSVSHEVFARDDAPFIPPSKTELLNISAARQHSANRPSSTLGGFMPREEPILSLFDVQETPRALDLVPESVDRVDRTRGVTDDHMAMLIESNTSLVRQNRMLVDRLERVERERDDATRAASPPLIYSRRSREARASGESNHSQGRLRSRAARMSRDWAPSALRISTILAGPDDTFGTGENAETEENVRDGFGDSSPLSTRSRDRSLDGSRGRGNPMDDSRHSDSSHHSKHSNPRRSVMPSNAQSPESSKESSNHRGSLFATAMWSTDTWHSSREWVEAEMRAIERAEENDDTCISVPMNDDEYLLSSSSPTPDPEAAAPLDDKPRIEQDAFVPRGPLLRTRTLDAQSFKQAAAAIVAKPEAGAASEGVSGKRGWPWLRSILISGVLAFLGVGALSFLYSVTNESDYALILGSFGAEAVLLCKRAGHPSNSHILST